MKVCRSFLALCLCGLLLTGCSDNSPSTLPEPEDPQLPVLPDEPVVPPAPAPDIVTLPKLTVQGRYLKNPQGEVVNLHGFTQTYSPFFNNNAWNNHNVADCLRYNKQMVDGILAAGWKMNFVRMHLDPYWSDDPAKPSVRYEGHERFLEARFRKYLDELFVPMADYFLSKGMYVVMRPPGVCPNGKPYEGIELGDSYQSFLLKVWSIVAQHPRLRNNTGIMFELANEPVNIKGTDGKFGSTGDACFANAKLYFQAIVDRIRQYCDNVIWVPGLGYQSQYAGYATHRIEGQNIGFAVHCYPGWYGSDAEEDSAEGIGSSHGGGYDSFQRGWDNQVGPVAAFAPIMVTEIDWAPKKYDATWGKSITGEAGGKGFGANFKYIADQSGNVSWLFFTTRSDQLAAFRDVPGTPGNYTFLNDPEACPWAMYHWFKEYAEGVIVNGEVTGLELMNTTANTCSLRMGDALALKLRARYADGTVRLVTHEAKFVVADEKIAQVVKSGNLWLLKAVSDGETTLKATFTLADGTAKELVVRVTVKAFQFSFTDGSFNPSIWEKGSFDVETQTLITGKFGFGGWKFAHGMDLSAYRTLEVELGNDNLCQASFRLFDANNYWGTPAMYDFGNSRKVVVDLHAMKDKNGRLLDPSHLYIIGFWSLGGQPIVIKSIILKK